MNPFNLSLKDIQEIDELVEEKKSNFNETRILITGGTGFIGKWILAFFLRLKTHSEVDIFVLTRNKRVFFNKYPNFETLNGFSFIEGDITSFKIFSNLRFDYVIHAAADVVKQNSDCEILDQNINGTSNVLKNIIASKSENAKILYLSSGAVYGSLINYNDGVIENQTNTGLHSLSAYGKGKLESEKLFEKFQYVNNNNSVAIARCFAFSGPLLPLDAQFAFGNFIGNSIKNKDIIIKGDGMPMRSYQYPTDLVRWLITLLLEVKSFDIVNVGDHRFISIKELALMIKDLTNDNIDVLVAKEPIGQTINTYLPNLQKAKELYNLTNNVSLVDSIIRTYNWNKLNTKE